VRGKLLKIDTIATCRQLLDPLCTLTGVTSGVDFPPVSSDRRNT
jgi:hypothetical protein